ncbi:MAG TPA: GNAT family N-acetyltransferase [Actinomycetaceae bacterium]|nr:GNAT family N-acetyltransferase [Actinomycetaceae bacterium]
MRSHPLTSLLAAQNLGYLGAGSQMLGIDGEDGLLAACWAGSNIVPVGSGEAIEPFSAFLRKRGRRASSIVGDADLVLPMWSLLETTWGPARDVRGNQPCLVIRARSAMEPDRRVRRAEAADVDLLLPASIAMFKEEVGYDPTRAGSGYNQYVRSLVSNGRAYIVIDRIDGREAVVFKADIGALWDGVAQVQGVWVHPDLRGKGFGTAAVAAVVADILTFAPTVSLYVNWYNTGARRVYEKVGFEQEATYATILL